MIFAKVTKSKYSQMVYCNEEFNSERALFSKVIKIISGNGGEREREGGREK